MSDRALMVAALIVGGAIVAATFSSRARYSLSAADGTTAWRMDTWSGQIDICRAVHLPDGPLVRCGAFVVTSEPPPAAEPGSTPEPTPHELDGQRTL